MVERSARELVTNARSRPRQTYSETLFFTCGEISCANDSLRHTQCPQCRRHEPPKADKLIELAAAAKAVGLDLDLANVRSLQGPLTRIRTEIEVSRM